MRKAALLLFTLAILVFMTSCGSQSPPPVTVCPADTGCGPIAVGTVSLTVTDTPPTGVTVLFFQLSITGATLTSSSGGTVSLYPGLLQQNAYPAIPVNVTQLQTDSAFLANANVGAGTYTGMSVTFSPNSQLTIYNGSGAAIGTGANACANNTVCQLTPSATNLTASFTTAPFPITLAPSTPLAFKLDVHLNTVIQPDLSVNLGVTNGVTVSQLPPPPSGTMLTALGNLTGSIQSVYTTTNPDTFTIQTGDGRSFTIGVSSSTTYSNFPSSTTCTSQSFACLATGQIVQAVVSLQTNTALLASQVTYVQPAGQMVVQGSIIRLSASGGNTLMDLILQQGPPPPATATALPAFGNRATVTVPPAGVNYAIDSDGFTLPGGLTFTTSANLMVGQQVSVVAVPGSVATTSNPPGSTAILGSAPTTFTASSISLEPSQITGTVSGWSAINVNALSYVLATYPNFFVPPPAAVGAPPVPASVNLTVQATSATTWTNLTPDSISGLAVGNVVSIKGWLFPYGAVPQICQAGLGCAPIGEIAAEAVVARPGPTPLF